MQVELISISETPTNQLVAIFHQGWNYIEIWIPENEIPNNEKDLLRIATSKFHQYLKEMWESQIELGRVKKLGKVLGT